MRYLARAYTWIVSTELCPCALRGPEWATRLCGRMDDYLWRHDLW